MAADGRERILIGANVTASVVLAAGLAAMVNWISYREWYRADWTRGAVYSLSPKAKKIVESLDKRVSVTVFLGQDDPSFDGVRELLTRMAQVSNNISVEYLDPDRNRDRAKRLLEKFKIYDLNAVVFECGGRSHYVTSDQMVDYDFDAATSVPRFRGFKAEQAFISAILDVTEERQVKACFLKGHGERDPDDFGQEGLSAASDELRRANYAIESHSINELAQRKASCDLLIAAGPVNPYSKEAVKFFEQFLKAGGRLMLLLDPLPNRGQTRLQETGVEAMLERLGAKILDGVVVDPDKATLLNPGTSFFADSYGDAEPVKPLAGRNIPVVFSQSRAFKLEDSGNGWKTARLVSSSGSSWLERDIASNGPPERNKGDDQGPLLLGFAMQVDDDREESSQADGGPKPGARLVVMGDSDFASNWMISSGGNLDLFLDLAHWLANKGSNIEIEAKSPEQVRISLSDAQMSAMFWGIVVLMPLLAIGLGVAVYIRRRA